MVTILTMGLVHYFRDGLNYYISYIWDMKFLQIVRRFVQMSDEKKRTLEYERALQGEILKSLGKF